MNLACAVVAMMMPMLAVAALPPLPQEVRDACGVIVRGRVVKIERTERPSDRPDYADDDVTITIAVTKVEKGKSVETLIARGWAVSRRPSGWAGPGGQHFLPKVGDEIKVYGDPLRDGSIRLLDPNGIDRLGK
jgi:hypothetical protein